MSDREGDTGIRPSTQEGGEAGTIPVPGPRPKRRIWQILSLIAAVIGVVAGFLGHDDALLIFCALSAILNILSLIIEGGEGGTIPVPGPKPRRPL